MADPQTGVIVLALTALVVGLIVFGGTTLIHFRDKSRRLPAKQHAEQERDSRAQAHEDRKAA